MTRPTISLGDAIRACYHLAPSDRSTVRELLELLQLHRRIDLPSASAPGVGAFKPSSSETVAVSQRRSPGEDRIIEPGPSPTTSRLGSSPTTAVAGPSTLRRVGRGTVRFATPAWYGESDDLVELGDDTPAPANAPLFSRVRRRGLLASAISTFVDEGDLDVDQIIERLGSCLALERVPRRLTLTTRRGAQVLLDRGMGLDPFVNDQVQVINALDDILDDDRLEVRDFIGCPSRGIVTEQTGEIRPWEPPPRGTPILVVTDLGIGGPRSDADRAASAEWLAFARLARAEGHLPLALVPYQATRWPPRVARVMPLLHWSERTTIAEVRHAMRDARERLKV